MTKLNIFDATIAGTLTFLSSYGGVAFAKKMNYQNKLTIPEKHVAFAATILSSCMLAYLLRDREGIIGTFRLL